MFRVGVGQAEDIHVLKATRAAIARSRIHLGGIQPQAGIVLCSSNFDHRQMLDTVLESLPGISLIGCTTAGDFSSSYGFSDDSITLILRMVRPLKMNQRIDGCPKIVMHPKITSMRIGSGKTNFSNES